MMFALAPAPLPAAIVLRAGVSEKRDVVRSIRDDRGSKRVDMSPLRDVDLLLRDDAEAIFK